MRSIAGGERFGRAEAAIAAFALAASAFIVLGEDTEASMFGLGFVGLVAVRALGVSRRSLFALAVVIAALIPAGLLGVLGGGSSHAVVSGLLAWALAEPVWSRMASSARPGRRVTVLVAVVLVLGVGWEIGERAADSLLGTSLSVSFDEALIDFLADALGALGGSLAAARYAAKRAAPSLGAPHLIWRLILSAFLPVTLVRSVDETGV